MYPQDRLTAFEIRKLHRNSSVETARSQEGFIKGLRTVCSRQDHNTLSSVKSIHFCKQLVQGLLALVISAHAASVTLFTDGIDLIDKDDTRSFLICLLEEVPDLRGTHADEHLNELRAGDREERNVRLTSNGLCK